MRLPPPVKVGKLQTALHTKAKNSPDYRFYALYDKVYRRDVLEWAFVRCLRNGGVPGVDGQSFDDIEKLGRDQWLDELAEELRKGTYHPQPVRRAFIPKGDGKQRPLGIPCIRDRVVQMATILLSVGGGDDFPRFSAAGWCVAWEPGPSDPVTSHPKPRFPATLAGAGCGSQVPRTRSHRLTHQPDGPLASTHRAPDPVMPRRSAGPIAATAASSRLSPPDCQRTPFRQQVFATSRRSARGRTAHDPPRFYISQILCL